MKRESCFIQICKLVIAIIVVKEKEINRMNRPGSVIAGLAVNGPLEYSGEFINWGDERLAGFRQRAT